MIISQLKRRETKIILYFNLNEKKLNNSSTRIQKNTQKIQCSERKGENWHYIEIFVF